jgi:putative ABC transport system permease protein
VRDWPVAAGRYFDEREQSGASPVALLGQTVADNLFAAGEDPIGATIRVKNVPFTVIGVLARKGLTSWGQDQDDVVMMPFSTAERRAFGTQILGTVDMIYASTNGPGDLEPASQQIRDVLRERHHIQPKQDEDFTVRNLNEIAEASKMASQVMSNLLLSVASISLLVGGIGIMNIMLVSVTERTREIGVRMAVGARTGHILVQFLVEAVVVSAFGGLIGVGVGLLGTSLISRLAQWPTLVSGSAIALAFSFSALVGIVFGFYPAKRASALDPIAALRSE